MNNRSKVLGNSSEPTTTPKSWAESHKANLIDLGQKLQAFNRVAIGGGPLTGKSLVASCLLKHYKFETDDFMDRAWADQPGEIIAFLDFRESTIKLPWCLSGVTVGRCLRKGLICDAVVFLEYPLEPLTFGQAKMAEGCKTVFNDWYFNYRKMTTPVFFL